MLSKYLQLIFSKKIFSAPQRAEILIIDRIFFNELKNIFGKNTGFLDVRLQIINIYVLIRLIFSGQRITYFNYLKNYIKISCPKVIITGNDNLIYFYEFKKFFPNIKFISIQNGFRNNLFFKMLDANKELKSDYIFVFSKYLAKYYKSKIKTKIIPIGSFYNNQIKISKNKKRKSILFISSGYPKKKNDYWNNKFKVSQKDYFLNDKILFKNIYKYCEKNKYNLEIMIKNYKDENEINYYKKLISNKAIFFHLNQNKKDYLYKTSDKVLVTVSSSSTFGFENLARGNKTAIFNNKSLITNGIMDIFWNIKIKKKGFFWSDNVDFNEVTRVMNKVLKISNNEWEQKVNPFKNKLMNYNYKNTIFFKIIKTLY